jgi:hypothetical protein
MKFHTQITLVALAILCGTLLLSSFLSFTAFERLYASTLISTYEVAAKSLQQKIETALKFGKPLGQFTGMDRLLADVLEMSPQIAGAGVADCDGRILYHTDPARVGQRFLLTPAAQAPLIAGATRQSGEVFITALPLCRQADDPVGILQITFSQGPVHDRLEAVAIQTLRDLVPLLAGAALLLAALLGLGLTRPLNHRLTGLSRWLETLGREGWGDPPGRAAARAAGPDADGRARRYEPDHLALCLAGFARHAGRTLETVAALQTEIDALEARAAALDGQVRLLSGGDAAARDAAGGRERSFYAATHKVR